MLCPHCNLEMRDRPEVAGLAFACPRCGGPFIATCSQFPVYQEPNYIPEYQASEPEPEPPPVMFSAPSRPTSYRMPRRTKEAPIWPGVLFGAGVAVLIYFTFLKDMPTLKITLESEDESAVHAVLRTLASDSNAQKKVFGLVGGLFLSLFGLLFYLLGRGSK